MTEEDFDKWWLIRAFEWIMNAIFAVIMLVAYLAVPAILVLLTWGIIDNWNDSAQPYTGTPGITSEVR